jgi:hypothetical protein
MVKPFIIATSAEIYNNFLNFLMPYFDWGHNTCILKNNNFLFLFFNSIRSKNISSQFGFSNVNSPKIDWHNFLALKKPDRMHKALGDVNTSG